jgi:hypothetical protein
VYFIPKKKMVQINNVKIWSLIFILGFNLVLCVLKVSIWSFIFIFYFNLVISVNFVTCGRRFAYINKHVDIWTFGPMSKWNSKISTKLKPKFNRRNQILNKAKGKLVAPYIVRVWTLVSLQTKYTIIFVL